jgi:hypothetical protein
MVCLETVFKQFSTFPPLCPLWLGGLKNYSLGLSS